MFGGLAATTQKTLNTCIVTDEMKAGIHTGYSIVARDRRKNRKPFRRRAQEGQLTEVEQEVVQ